jgi:hypothetical protein
MSAVKRNLLVTAACVLSCGLALGTWSSANASSKATIRTYTEHATVSFKGVGGGVKGYLSYGTDSESVILAPHLALKSSTGTYVVLQGHVSQSSGRFDIVGRHSYTKLGGQPWMVESLSAASTAHYAQQLNPYIALSKFSVLPGIRRLSATRFTVTGSVSRISSFLSWEYSLPAKAFAGTGIRTVTVNLLLDNRGRPVKFTVAARSSTYVVSVTETFSNYNQPLTISAP